MTPGIPEGVAVLAIPEKINNRYFSFFAGVYFYFPQIEYLMYTVPWMYTVLKKGVGPIILIESLSIVSFEISF